MNRPRFEVADVIRVLGGESGKVPGLRLNRLQRRVVRRVAACRTAVLGGHLEECDSCDYDRAAYNSCRDRHCPKCQGQRQAQWLEARRGELLPVPYFHVVFTMHEALARLALQNKKVIYDLLFRCASATLKKIGADPKHLGAEIGFFAVLHTWGQTLHHHPHVHCVVPGGGLSKDGTRWVGSRADFFLPVRVLSAVYRGMFVSKLRRAFNDGRLVFAGKQAELGSPAAFRDFCDQLMSTDWVVYAKAPFGGPEQVLKYLARYTHRVAISNWRLLAVSDSEVSFSYKDYARGSARRAMKLQPVEFLRRFLLHVLPRGFVRIRSYGYLANRCRKGKLARCRELLEADDVAATDEAMEVAADAGQNLTSDRCPVCETGRLIRRVVPRGNGGGAYWDSS